MIRVGFGYDAHRLEEGLPLVLGGVAIPYDKGLAAHSDGDVILHAAMDALLGAAALGDIGKLFPDTDPRYERCSSLSLLGEVGQVLSRQGYVIQNIDCTLVAQRPRILPYVPEMRRCISQTLDIDVDRVSVKGTTTEGLGFSGREEGLQCYAICCISGPVTENPGPGHTPQL